MVGGHPANGIVAFAFSQIVSEHDSWLEVILLMGLWHLPALSM